MNLYLDKINTLLKKNLSEKCFDLWEGIRDNISNKCWDKLTSSTGKYHKKENGYVPSVAEHTYEMIYAADKIISMFEGIISKDVIFLSIALHDAYKYGLCKTCQHTEEKHGELIAETILKNKKIYAQALTENEIIDLETAVRYHDGRWSPIAKKNHFDKTFLTPEVTFLYTLDMLSSRNLIKVVEETNDIIKN